MGAILDSGFSARKIPFYGLPQSRVFEDDVTVSAALYEAGLDFLVGKRPVHQQLDSGQFSQVDGQFVTYRMDTQRAFGTVGNQWQPFQNEPALDLCDELLGFGARITAAGTWNGGEDVFVTAQLPEGIIVPGEENLDLYLLFRNNHAGKGAVSCYITPVRISCTNMMSSAIGKAVSSWKCRHTATVSDRVHEAAAAMNLVDKYKQAYESIAVQLQETEIAMDEVDLFLAELTEAKRVQENIKETYETSPTVTQGNRWGLFNAVTESLDWHSPRQTQPETRFASQIDGPISRCRQRAMNLLTR